MCYNWTSERVRHADMLQEFRGRSGRLHTQSKSEAALNTRESASSGLPGCLTRIVWFFGGYAVLFMLSAKIVVDRSPLPSYRDAAFWSVAVAIIVLRYVDIRYLHGDTGDGKPATMQHWRRYAVFVAIGSLLLWLATRGIVWLRT